jgi:hypothetical protein
MQSVQDQSMQSARRIPMWPGRRILEMWIRGLLDEPPVSESLKTKNPGAATMSIICLSLIL